MKEKNLSKNFVALATAGLFHYFIWTIYTIIRRPKTDSPVNSQIIAFGSVIAIATIPVVMFAISFFISPPPNVQNLMFAATIASVTIFLSVKHEVEALYFIFILIFNIIQGFGLFTLYQTNEFTLLLFTMIIIQAILLTPSLESFERQQLLGLVQMKNQNILMQKLLSIAKSTPLAISQFYRDYVYLLSCSLLYMTTVIHIRISSNAAKSTDWSIINNLFKTPSTTGFLIFFISLILIVLRKNTTDFKSGWGRSIDSIMKENFNLILSIYTLIALFSISLYRFHAMKDIYFDKEMMSNLMISSQAFFDVIFITVIFYYLLTMAFELKSNPKYQLQQTQQLLIDHPRGKTQIAFVINNNSKEVIECNFINLKNIEIDKTSEKKKICVQGSTRLIFNYDRSSVKYPSLNDGYIDITMTRRRYKHRLYFSALHTFDILKEQQEELKREGNIKNLYIDQSIIYNKFKFKSDEVMMSKSHVGFLNTTNKSMKITLFNSDELKDRSIEVFLLDESNKPCDELLVPGKSHKPNSAEIIFNYKNLDKELDNNVLIASIEFQVNDFEIITLPYIIEIEPMIYNDLDCFVTVVYPEGTINKIPPSSIENCRATNIPVKLKYDSKEKNYETFITLKPGLTLLSNYTSGTIEKSSNLKGFNSEIALVGLKGSGKTTYLTALNKESLKPVNNQSDLPILPVFNDKRLRNIMDDYMRLLNKNSFPPSTSMQQFDSFHFQIKKGNINLSITVKDIAGEYFSSEFSNELDLIQEKARLHFNQAEFVFITIDTAPDNYEDYDKDNQILLDNITRKNDNYDPAKIRILYTKIDKSKVNKENIKDWLYNNLPKTAKLIYTAMNLNDEAFYYITVGEAENKRIIKYNAQNIIKPISDILSL